MKKLKTILSEFMITPLGSFVKGFISVVLAMYIKEVIITHNIFIPMTKEFINDLVIAGIAPNFQLIINWINPSYKNYGIGKDTKDGNGDDNDISSQSGLITAIIFFIVLTGLVSACNP